LHGGLYVQRFCFDKKYKSGTMLSNAKLLILLF